MSRFFSNVMLVSVGFYPRPKTNRGSLGFRVRVFRLELKGSGGDLY